MEGILYFFFFAREFFPLPIFFVVSKWERRIHKHAYDSAPLYPSGNNAFNLTDGEKNARRSIGFSYARYRYRLYQIFASVSVVVIVFNDY